MKIHLKRGVFEKNIWEKFMLKKKLQRSKKKGYNSEFPSSFQIWRPANPSRVSPVPDTHFPSLISLKKVTENIKKRLPLQCFTNGPGKCPGQGP